jgi:hypothetical protein
MSDLIGTPTKAANGSGAFPGTRIGYPGKNTEPSLQREGEQAVGQRG